MQKYAAPAVIFVLLFCMVFLAATGCGLVSPKFAGGLVPADMKDTSYILTGLETSQAGTGITLVLGADTPPLSLVIAEIGSFTMRINGRAVYAYDAACGYDRTHQIPLETGPGTQQILIAHTKSENKAMFLLGTLENTSRAMRLCYGIAMLVLGFYITIIFYSLSLYLRKKTEKYLLLLLILSVTAFVSALSSSVYIAWPMRQITQPIRYFRIVFSCALCFKLSGFGNGGKLGFFLKAPGMAALTLFFFLLYMLRWELLYDVLAYSLAIPAAVAVIIGAKKGLPGAYVLLAGTALREGLRYFEWGVSEGVVAPFEPMLYYYIPQFSSALFTMACLIKINILFAQKFHEADALVAELARFNQTLDEKIVQRTCELAEANARILAQQQDRSRLMVNIFHDLRSPVFHALGAADMLEATTEKEKLLLATIQNRLKYLSHLIGELFMLAKLEDGTVTLDQFRVRLEELCAAVAGAYTVEAEQKGLHIELNLQHGVAVTGDSFHLRTLLENLFSNAVKYTAPNGSIRVTLRTEGNRALFCMHNDAVLPREKLTSLFERRNGGRGSGLGLAIVQEVVKAHKGTIAVTSNEQSGTQFVIELPLEDIGQT